MPPSFRFPSPLKEGEIISRPNRFIMRVNAGEKTLICHCPTTGRLGDLALESLHCLYSTSENPRRKTAYTVEAISVSRGKERAWIGINQTAANRYIEYFLNRGTLSRIATGQVKREVVLGNSRIDFLVGDTYIEVKTPLITLPSGDRVGRERRRKFDSFERLIRHLAELRKVQSAGHGGAILLCYLYDAPPFKTPRRNGTNSQILTMSRSAEHAGVRRWQVNLEVGKNGVSLIRYFELHRDN
jgi:sugar fermentation stimulation protein A